MHTDSGGAPNSGFARASLETGAPSDREVVAQKPWRLPHDFSAVPADAGLARLIAAKLVVCEVTGFTTTQRLSRKKMKCAGSHDRT